jgi:ABC-type lipoprotein release transport system permease subunit
MDNPLVISLFVTGIGMLMLFLALALLYGLMVLMTRMTDMRGITSIRAQTRERPDAEAEEQETGSRKQEASIAKQRAAAVAAALARAERELSTVGVPRAEREVSAWRALHHQRQLTLNLPARRAR